MTLVDRFNRPLKADKAALAQEVARPSMTGVRQAWDPATAVAGLTPDRLDSILRSANSGDMRAFLTLAEEMEERDPHYGSVLQTRKLAVLGLERQLTWAPGHEDHPKATEILEACQQLVAAPAFEDLLHHLLDAIAKGYAAPEVVWKTSTKLWTPERYEWRDPRFFQFDRETGRELRLRDVGHPEGVQLQPFKFVVHRASRKSGLPARGGLARLVAFSFVCKLYGLKDWLAYAEIFGIPLRLGKYDASATPADVAVLKRAVFGLGSDAAAVLPKSMEIDFPNMGAVGGEKLFQGLVTWIDNQVSKAVIGQTGSADMQSGGGYAQAKVQEEVRTDLTKADARSLGATITRDLLTPFVAFNWGPDAPVPAVELLVDEPEDVKSLSEALGHLVPLGLRVGAAEIRKKLRLSEPAADAEVLTPPATAAASGPALTRDQRQPGLARAGSGQGEMDAALDEAQLVELDGWEQAWGPEAGAVIEVVRKGGTFEEIQAGLQGLAGDLHAPAAARSLARAMFAAAALGDDQVRR